MVVLLSHLADADREGVVSAGQHHHVGKITVGLVLFETDLDAAVGQRGPVAQLEEGPVADRMRQGYLHDEVPVFFDCDGQGGLFLRAGGKTESVLLRLDRPHLVLRILAQTLMVNQVLLVTVQFASGETAPLDDHLQTERAEGRVGEEGGRVGLVGEAFRDDLGKLLIDLLEGGDEGGRPQETPLDRRREGGHDSESREVHLGLEELGIVGDKH